MNVDPTQSNSPILSVIVPVYNGTNDLKHCLAALAASHYDNFEVLVVDDGSTEPVEALVDQYGFRYLRLEGPGGPARARNRGAAHVQGQYLVFVDADVCVHQDTLARFAERFAADPAIDAIVGCYDDSPAVTTFLSQYKNLFHHYVHHRCDGMISTFWSGCGAIRRELFIAWGFDERQYRRPSIEDVELGTWLYAAGHRIILDNRIQGKHLKRWTLGKLLKTDIFDRGIPWTHLMLRAGRLANTLNVQPMQRLSVALVYLMGLSACLGLWWPQTWLVTIPLAVLVSVLNYDFYRYFSKRLGFWFALRVVPLHWLYFVYCGLSFILGSLQYYLGGCLRNHPGNSWAQSYSVEDERR
jgi:glycosyltransferase involved in cell wall biosynthesis